MYKREKSPVKSTLAQGLTSLDPKMIFPKSTLAVKRIDIVVEGLHNSRIHDKVAEQPKQQFSLLTDEAQTVENEQANQ